jgi:hypothetical protein
VSVTDEAVYRMRIECDGKPSPLGCAVSIDTTQFTREQCNQHFYASGWRILGKPVDLGAPETGEPTFDDSVFHIDCAARPLYPSETKA